MPSTGNLPDSYMIDIWPFDAFEPVLGSHVKILFPGIRFLAVVCMQIGVSVLEISSRGNDCTGQGRVLSLSLRRALVDTHLSCISQGF